MFNVLVLNGGTLFFIVKKCPKSKTKYNKWVAIFESRLGLWPWLQWLIKNKESIKCIKNSKTFTETLLIICMQCKKYFKHDIVEYVLNVWFTESIVLF